MRGAGDAHHIINTVVCGGVMSEHQKMGKRKGSSRDALTRERMIEINPHYMVTSPACRTPRGPTVVIDYRTKPGDGRGK